ncbi:MAG: DUF2304 domain-containing protein [Lachnospiraceae bacterium]|nr:DUF2304 domain-containing protein [Lachnospiraceae bacterium]
MIDAGDLLRIILFVMGAVMLFVTVASLAKRKMNESFCLVWGIVSVATILAGCLLRPSEWTNYMSGVGLALVLVIIFCALYCVYFVSLKISELTRKNQELAIQVSLLNQENEKIMKRLSDMTGLDKREI